VPVTVGTSRLSCGKAVKREYSRQFGSHPGNPGNAGFNPVVTRQRQARAFAIRRIDLGTTPRLTGAAPKNSTRPATKPAALRHVDTERQQLRRLFRKH
jgi:hypothetical protein